MPLTRVLEPEIMDTAAEAAAYDVMDHSEVNRIFVEDFLKINPQPQQVLDVGTGTALIPIQLAKVNVHCQILGIDLAAHMLAFGQKNVAAAGFQARIQLQQVDAKSLPFADASFDAVVSNSIVHHIPDPRTILREMGRVLGPKGSLFVRDLYRPESDSKIVQLVDHYAADADPIQRELFRASLAAAFTVAEVLEMEKVG